MPEFGAAGKEAVTLRHLFAHTAHLGGYLGPLKITTWDDTVARICAAPRERPQVRLSHDEPPAAPPRPLGTTPVYNPAGTWILAEVCRRVDGRPHDVFVREEVFEPCGMDDCWNGMPAERYHAYGQRIGGPADPRFPAPPAAGATRAQPAGGGVGPTRQPGRFYEVLLARGDTGSGRLLEPQTIEAMTARHTTAGMHWGLGFNSNHPDPDAAVADGPGSSECSAYGRFSSPRAFGHNGATGMQAFADPQHGLVLRAIAQPRLSLADGVYTDLSLAPARA